MSRVKNILRIATLIFAGFMVGGCAVVGVPYTKTWSELHWYDNAQVELESPGPEWWVEHSVLSGSSKVININEGAKLMNTTAHPQYLDIYIQLPSALTAGQVFSLRSVEGNRTVSRQGRWGKGMPLNDYSIMLDGEVAVSGMRGYDIPRFASRKSVQVGAVTVEELGKERAVVKIDIDLNLETDRGKPYIHAMHRRIVLKRKRRIEQKPDPAG